MQFYLIYLQLLFANNLVQPILSQHQTTLKNVKLLSFKEGAYTVRRRSNNVFTLAYSLSSITKTNNDSSRSNNKLYGLRKTRDVQLFSNDVKVVRFSANIENFYVNIFNENVYVITNNQTLILDKNLDLKISNSENTDNSECDNAWFDLLINVFYFNSDTITILKCLNSSNGDTSSCNIRNFTDSKCSSIRFPFNSFTIPKITDNIVFQKNFLQTELNYLYFMPNIINLSDGEYNHSQLLFIFNLSSLNPFQPIGVSNQEFEIENEYVTRTNEKQSLNVIYNFIVPTHYDISSCIYNFIYVLNNNKNETITKLLRICKGETYRDYISYSEVSLTCVDDYNELLTEALSADFNRKTLYVLFKKSNKNSTILCSLEIDDIVRHFNKYISNCLYGTGSYEENVSTCKNDFKNTNNSSCRCPRNMTNNGQSDFVNVDHAVANIFINIKEPLELYKVNLKLQGENINKIHSSKVDDDEILFVTTDKLNLYFFTFYWEEDLFIKNIFTEVSRKNSSAITLGSTDIVNDIRYSEKSSLLYLSSGSKLIKVDYDDECSIHSTCSECSHSINPLCRWCLISKKCSVYSKCLSGLLVPRLNSKTSTCQISSILYNDKTTYIQDPAHPPFIYFSSLTNNLVKINLNFTIEFKEKHKLSCLLADGDDNIQETRLRIDKNKVLCDFSGKMNLKGDKDKYHLDIKFKFANGSDTSTLVENFGSKFFHFYYINCMKRVNCDQCVHDKDCVWHSIHLKCFNIGLIDSYTIKDETRCLNKPVDYKLIALILSSIIVMILIAVSVVLCLHKKSVSLKNCFSKDNHEKSPPETTESSKPDSEIYQNISKNRYEPNNEYEEIRLNNLPDTISLQESYEELKKN